MIQRRTGAILGVLVLVLAALFSSLRAADEVGGIGEPDDPTDDNACFEGGTLWRENGDGCPTEWHWKAGWYLQRVETGEIPVEDVPDEFESAMPPTPTATPSLIEICKNSPYPYPDGTSTYTRCFRSDQTGTAAVDGVLQGYFFFFDTVDPCYALFNDPRFTPVF
ncbi:MAG: hypothetical protein JNM70_23330, partial [Anaerolineae bacterium]|nr:hypothetical protein [Anaerolineae bacterium]